MSDRQPISNCCEQLLRAARGRLRESLVVRLSFAFAMMTFASGTSGAQKPNEQSQSNLGTETSLIATDLDEGYEKHVLPFFENYCLDCHAGEDGEGGIDLVPFEDAEQVEANIDLLGRAYSEISDLRMPPADADQPTRKERNNLKTWVRAAVRAKTTLARTPTRRLNRIEYENSVRDLLQFNRNVFSNPANIVLFDSYFDPQSKKMPKAIVAASFFSWAHIRPGLSGVSTLPIDPPVEHGYSNDYRSLSISPLLLENYFQVADSIVRSPTFPRAIGVWDELFNVDDSMSDDDKIEATRDRLLGFLPRAFRRPIDESDLELYLGLYKSELKKGQSHIETMQTVLSAILVSPNFIFRDDFVASVSQSSRHNDYAMASRLSYFLWASAPDSRLLELAAEGQLRDPDVLRQQVKRMLADKKCKSLSTDFGMQWLKIKKVNSAKPDKDQFPRYYQKRYPPPGVSMTIEQLLLFETVLVEDRSIVDFLNADYAYLNRRLMHWYHLKPDELVEFLPRKEDVEDFIRIKWPNKHRGGVISSGAMLVSTSTSTRTSPVYRGAWILDVILNRPPPPPPADVPELDDAQQGNRKTVKNIRDRLDIHREDAACAGCHDRIDPLGYAMENYNAVAQFRKKYDDGERVDTSGVLFGDEFSGAAKLKIVLVKHKDKFVRAFVEHVMTYALGRPLSVSDMPEIERITINVLKQDCRFSSVITEVVLSKQFLMPVE